MSVAVAVGLALRVVFALGYWVDKPLTGDELEYLSLARSLSTGNGFTYPPQPSGGIDEPHFARAPLYPFFLAAITPGAVRQPAIAAVPRAIKVVQALVGAALIAVLAAIAWTVAGASAAMAAAIVTAVYPPFVWLPSYALSEVLYATLVWICVLLLVVCLTRASTASGAGTGVLLAAGIVGGLAALTRPSAIMLLALAAVWIVLRLGSREAIVFVLGCALAIGPWTVRNARAYGRLVPIAAQGGVNFWIGNHPLAHGEGDLNANPPIKQANLEFLREHPGSTTEALEPLYYRDALRHIASHPLWWTGLLVRKAFYLFVPIGPSYDVHSARYRIASVYSYLALVPFAIFGAATLFRMRNWEASVLVLMFASVILTALLFFPQERYRIPELDPTLIVCAASGLAVRASRPSPVHA